MKTPIDTSKLPPGVWFVRGNRRNRLHPVTAEGRRVAWLFVMGMAGSGLLAGLLVAISGWIWWLGLMPVGMAYSGFWFIRTAMRHSDSRIQIRDLQVKE